MTFPLVMKKNHRPLFLLSERMTFPPVEEANDDGLLAVGGDLSPERLLLAYRNGIFPWFNEGSIILWWRPDPRMVLFLKDIVISKSMQKVLARVRFRLTKNTGFTEVLDRCASVKRRGQQGTWITGDMKRAYTVLHEMGLAISYEVWVGGQLVGGLYGIDLGHVFCGESMFSTVSNASKFAVIKLARELEAQGYALIDCQVYTDHLASMGAREIPRARFLKTLIGEDQ